jgi:hypothetical protein
VPDLSSYLGQPLEGRVAFAHAAQDSQAVTAAALLERLRPGTADLDARAWDEVVEVSWRAAAGLASVTGPDGTG